MVDVESIFNEALERDPEEREEFLTEACGGNTSLRKRIKKLIDAHTSAGDFLLQSAAPDPTTHEAVVAETPGDRIGDYVLREKLGEGGFGMVYHAEQLQPIRREVAFKIIKLGMDTKQVITRFEAERQALALTDHINIAKVFDAGSTESGRPYFVMELVKGVAIHKYCDTHKLSVEARLNLFADVCRGVQHAHQKGLVHRDLKPSNILVAVQDGHAVPKVIDFGVAKATTGRLSDATLYTELGQLLGTPAYMSPEQAEGTGLEIDTRTDVYALGVILYELLTGTTPIESKRLREIGLAEVQRVIREEDPPPPSQRVLQLDDKVEKIAKSRSTTPEGLRSAIKGDLDWITLQALEKDRTRRYGTPDSLAADVLRHLNSQPVQARPPGTLYVLERFVRRNKIAVTAGVTISITLLVGIAVAIWSLIEVSAAKAISDKQATVLGNAAYSPQTEGLLVDAEEVFGPSHHSTAFVYSQVGEFNYRIGELALAEDHLRKAIEIFQDSPEGQLAAIAGESTLASLLLDLSRTAEALDHLQWAILKAESLEEVPHNDLADLYAKKARVNSVEGDYEGAVLALEKARDNLLASGTPSSARLGDVHAELAAAYQDNGQGTLAGKARETSLTYLAEAFPNSLRIANLYIEFGLTVQKLPSLSPLPNLPSFSLQAAEKNFAMGIRIYEGKDPSLQRGSYYLQGLVGLAEELEVRRKISESDSRWARALDVANVHYLDRPEEHAVLIEKRLESLDSQGRKNEAAALRTRFEAVLNARGSNENF